MNWEISGWRGETQGRWSVEAECEDAALRKAAAAGLRVESIEMVAEPDEESAIVRVAAVAVAAPPVQSCANCGRTIGRLETPWHWAGHVVCQECASRLSPPDEQTATAPQPQVNVTVSAPTYYPPASYGGRRAVTIERTSKVWKAQMVLAALCAILGVALASAAANMPGSGIASVGGMGTRSIMGVGVLMVIAGVAWFIVARIGAWWNHG